MHKNNNLYSWTARHRILSLAHPHPSSAFAARGRVVNTNAGRCSILGCDDVA